jgi:spore coat polysaccharide biosynthesis predicted glycosyltransferase SpsG
LHRSLALADLCSKKGISPGFICAESSGSALKKIRDKGYVVHILEKNEQFSPHSYTDIIGQKGLIVFDTDDPKFHSGKLIDTLRENKIKTACFTITDEYDITTDLLINPNIISETHRYRTARDTKLLIGPKYMIFSELYRQPSVYGQPDGKKKNLLVFFGNADTNRLTIRFIPIIRKLSDRFDKIFVIIGSLNKDGETIRQRIQTGDSERIRLFSNVVNMSEIYQQTSTALSSGGMAMWERALFNISQLIIASSDREKVYTDYLHEQKYIYKLGDFDHLPEDQNMFQKINRILNNDISGILNSDEFKQKVNPEGIDLIVDNLMTALNSEE